MKQLHTLWLCIFIAGISVMLSAQQQVLPGKSSDDFAANECLIKFKSPAPRKVIDSLGSELQFSILEYFPGGKFYRVKTPETSSVQSFIIQLLKHSEIEAAQPDYFVSVFGSSCDSTSAQKWGSGPVENGGCNIEAAQKVIDGTLSDISIGYIDVATHPYESIADFFNGVRVIPISIAAPDEKVRSSRLIEGIWQCIDKGYQIIAINAGSPDAPLLQHAIMKAFNRGLNIFCAASDSAACAKKHIFPAAYNQYCLAVASHGYQGIRQKGSVGGDYIDLSAPGEIVLSKVSNLTLCGTSVATLYVSVTAALLSAKGINGYDKIRQALEQSCFDPQPNGWDCVSGWGFLDALKAVQYFPKPDHDVMITGFKVPQWGIRGEHLQLIVTVKNQGNFIHDISLVLTDQTVSKTIATTKLTIKPDQSSQYVFQWNTEQEPQGQHFLTITAVLNGDEDDADNTQYRDVTIIDDTRDVEISGIECFCTPDEQQLNSSVQLWNKGTYTEMAIVKIEDLKGTVLGKKDTSIQPQSLLSLPIRFTSPDPGKEKLAKVSAETSDLQENDTTNNSRLFRLIYPSTSQSKTNNQ